jgi:hypothetical protein
MADAAALHYGAILHPTIENISEMVCNFWAKVKAADPNADWRNLRLWKMDLRGAYTLLSFRPEDIGLFAMMLTDNVVYLQLAGIFGWAGTPAAFQVVTRAIQWELRHALTSSTIMYVDDIVGVCMASDVTEDLRRTREICVNLLGPTSVADDKTECGRRMEVIGYVIDLDARRVSISRKNLLAALHGFFSVDIGGKMNVRTAQKLSSWSSRYGKICRVMRPFCGGRLIAGRTEVHATFHLSKESQIAIKCWQAMLCLVRYQETRFTRTLESFAPSLPAMVAEFDASLSGAGLIWSHRSNGTEAVVGVSAVDISFLQFGTDSSYQNLCEFLGAILSVVGHIILGNRGRSLALRGDSVTALTWAFTESPRGAIVTNAAMIWTLLCVAADVHIRETTHIPGEENDRCDQLSRRGPNPTQSVDAHATAMGLPGVPDLQLQRDANVMALLTLCDPAIEIDTDDLFTTFWTRARQHIDALLTGHPLPPPTLPPSLLDL